MKRTDFSVDWLFAACAPDTELLPWNAQFTPVDLPHDWQIRHADDLYRDGTLFYRKYFFVTDVPGLMLVTAYADCVPLYFADTRLHVIGLSHSGWRGTVNNIADVTVKKMTSLYGSNPADIIAFVGPSICRNCYEVGSDVADVFAARYGEKVFDGILNPAAPDRPFDGKFRLDLHRANVVNLLAAGLLEENIGVTDICTCCNPGLLFSHRASKGQRGGLCGFMEIR